MSTLMMDRDGVNKHVLALLNAAQKEFPHVPGTGSVLDTVIVVKQANEAMYNTLFGFAKILLMDMNELRQFRDSISNIDKQGNN